jgi:spermidine synthase
MKNVNLWQFILSWLYPVHLETIGDNRGNPLRVFLRYGRLKMESSNAIYSYDDYYINFLVPLTEVYSPPQKPKNVLLLGFGMGSIVYILEKKLHCPFTYTAVELDESVIYLASKYSLPRFTSPIQMIQADASLFVEYCEDRFDLICIDVFEDSEVPEVLEEKSFLEDCKELLNPGGVVFFNRLYQFSMEKQHTQDYFDKVFLEVFPLAKCWEVKGNLVLHAQI